MISLRGTLAVEGAKEKMMKLADYINSVHTSYDYICVTLDTHPENHCSFKENGGIWPKHCVFATNGWDIPEYLNEALKDANFVSCYRKGTEADSEEYSIFDNDRDGFALYSQIKELTHQGTADFSSEDSAEEIAYQFAIEEYEMYEGFHGIRSWTDIADEEGLDYEKDVYEINEIYEDERESWMEYYVRLTEDDELEEDEIILL